MSTAGDGVPGQMLKWQLHSHVFAWEVCLVSFHLHGQVAAFLPHLPGVQEALHLLLDSIEIEYSL